MRGSWRSCRRYWAVLGGEMRCFARRSARQGHVSLSVLWIRKAIIILDNCIYINHASQTNASTAIASLIRHPRYSPPCEISSCALFLLFIAFGLCGKPRSTFPGCSFPSSYGQSSVNPRQDERILGRLSSRIPFFDRTFRYEVGRGGAVVHTSVSYIISSQARYAGSVEYWESVWIRLGGG